MAATAIITIRIDPKLLDALKQRAQEQGRSVSSEVVQLIRASVPAPRSGRARKSTMGMLAGQFEDLDRNEYERARDDIAASVRKAVARRSRRSE